MKTNPTLLFIVLLAVAGIILVVLIMIRQKKKRSIAPPEDLREAARCRSRLEEEIMAVIGGKTGMLALWQETLNAAKAGDDSGFLLYARAFSEKVGQLAPPFRELIKLRAGEGKDASGNQLAAFVYGPFRYERECYLLLAWYQLLQRSGLTERERIDPQTLQSWAEQDTDIRKKYGV